VEKTSIFIIPRSSTAWKGNEAGWITASGWASAGQQLWGEALVATSDGIFTPQQSMLFPRNVSSTSQGKQIDSAYRKLIPEFLITGYKDIKLKRSKPAVWPVEKMVLNKKVMMVWERHDLFSGPGRRLADKLGVPLVISVEAPAVWEAKKWGVKRPLWGSYLEKYVEAVSLKSADLVSCVSEEVRDQVLSYGVLPEKVIVSHNKVDSTVFNPDVNGDEILEKYNLKGKRVLGWTGSFRNFHGLDTVVSAFKTTHERFPDTVLMLVGDGLEFSSIKKQIEDLNLSQHVILTGRQPFTDIPKYVANFHIALVSASSSEGFHYSPLKLREYLASGKAVIAPNAGDLPHLFKDNRDLLFYRPGNIENLSSKMNILLEDNALHGALCNQAKMLFLQGGTWIHELKKVCDTLNISY
jgi:glycosyltransferase involved in cell wall biosynthesis